MSTSKYVQVTGLNVYPARKYSVRTVKQIDPFLYLGRYVNFSYDFHNYQELLRILTQGGSFEQIEKKSDKPTIFSFNIDTYEMTVDCQNNKRLSNTYKLNREVLDDIIFCIKQDVCETMEDDKYRESVKNKAAIERVKSWREGCKTSSETAPESPKETLPDIPMQKEESVVETQENDKEDVYTNNQKVEEKKPINMLGHGIDEVIDIILKKNKIESVEELNKPSNISLKFDINGQLWPSQRQYFENRYGITGPDDMFNELMKVFKPC